MIPEPTDPLWPPVKASSGWIEMNEDGLKTLATALDEGAASFEKASRYDTTGLRSSWRDGTATTALTDLAAVLKTAGEISAGLKQAGATTLAMEETVRIAKQAIVDSIANHSKAYQELNDLPFGLREVWKFFFEQQLAGFVQETMNQAAQAIARDAQAAKPPIGDAAKPPAGAPAAPPPGEEKKEEEPGALAKEIGDWAGLVSSIAGAVALIPGAAIIAGPIALAAGAVALVAHGISAAQGGDTGLDIAGDVVGLIPGVGAALGGFRAVNASVGIGGRLAGSLLAVENAASGVGTLATRAGTLAAPGVTGAVNAAGRAIASHAPSTWARTQSVASSLGSFAATGDGVARVVQGTAGLAPQIPGTLDLFGADVSDEAQDAGTIAGIAVNVAGSR